MYLRFRYLLGVLAVSPRRGGLLCTHMHAHRALHTHLAFLERTPQIIPFSPSLLTPPPRPPHLPSVP